MSQVLLSHLLTRQLLRTDFGRIVEHRVLLDSLASTRGALLDQRSTRLKKTCRWISRATWRTLLPSSLRRKRYESALVSMMWAWSVNRSSIALRNPAFGNKPASGGTEGSTEFDFLAHWQRTTEGTAHEQYGRIQDPTLWIVLNPALADDTSPQNARSDAMQLDGAG
jgi:hypothetical protein